MRKETAMKKEQITQQQFKVAMEMMHEICEGKLAYSYELVKRILTIMKKASEQGAIHHE